LFRTDLVGKIYVNRVHLVLYHFSLTKSTAFFLNQKSVPNVCTLFGAKIGVLDGRLARKWEGKKVPDDHPKPLFLPKKGYNFLAHFFGF